MQLKDFLLNPHHRITATHLLLILILMVTLFSFSHSLLDILIQVTLIVVVVLHHKDDIAIKQKLTASEKFLTDEKDVFERNVIITESDLNGIITAVNPKFCEVTGFAKEELLGKPYSIFKDPSRPPSFYEDLWETIEAGETFTAVFKILRKDGKNIWLDTSISPIFSHSQIVAYKAIRFDITKQIDAKSDLEEEKERFSFAMNASRDGFWDYNLIKDDFYLSPAWKERLGFSEESKITYEDYLALLPETSRIQYRKNMEDIHLIQKGKVSKYFRMKYPITSRGNEKIIIEDVGNAFFNSQGHLIRMSGFHRDVTEQERQNKIIASQNRIATMGEVVGNIAHQWRQPIAAINNVLNDIEIDIELEDKKQIPVQTFIEVSHKVKTYTQYLSHTIDDFRSISSKEKVKSSFSLNKVLNDAYALVENSYTKYGIKVEINKSDKRLSDIVGYERELIQVILNIFNNAKDIFVEMAIENPCIIVNAIENERQIIITILDNAGGIPDTAKDKIFDPYFTTKHESVGTGIGLYMSRKIINEDFEGSLSVSNEEQGAKFTLVLPKNPL